jgi:hypothetical protein
VLKIGSTFEASHAEIPAHRLKSPSKRLSSPGAFINEQNYDLLTLRGMFVRAMRTGHLV